MLELAIKKLFKAKEPLRDHQKQQKRQFYFSKGFYPENSKKRKFKRIKNF